QGKKKETELKLKARVPAFELFIGNEGRAKEEIKRPAHPKSAAAEVENHKSAQQASEEKLQEIEEPIVELRGPTFPFAIDILPAIGRDERPEVFPEPGNDRLPVYDTARTFGSILSTFVAARSPTVRSQL